MGAVTLRQSLREGVKLGVRALVHEEARDMRGDLELLALVSGDLKVEQMALLTKMVWRWVPRR